MEQQEAHSIMASADRVEKHKDKPHVTWDEDQIAEHDKTRGQKMKIDEPKTPYVTDEEFKKLCDEDPDYKREFGESRNAELPEVDFNS